MYFINKPFDLKNCCFPVFFFLVLCSLFSCQSDSGSDVNASIPAMEKIQLDYAKGFEILKGEGFWEVLVTQPWTGSERTFHYLILEPGQEMPSSDYDAVINLPVEKVILTSTTQIPHLDLLGDTDKLLGFPQLQLISSPKARARIDSGLVEDLGSGPSANPEMIIDLEPDFIMISTLGDDLRYLELLQNAGIPALINGEYVEQHPLGRAEWIKFTGLFLGKYEEAVKVFKQVELDYLEAMALAEQIPEEERPTVLSGVMYQDIWYAPGRDSWGAMILSDAGGDYVFEEQEGVGSLQLNYEFVLEEAMNAEYWIGSADYSSLEGMGENEPRYQAIKAFQEGKVFTYTQKKGAAGGLEYFELGYMRPDLILKDLIKILHPDLLPEYDLYFYRQLDEK